MYVQVYEYVYVYVYVYVHKYGDEYGYGYGYSINVRLYIEIDVSRRSVVTTAMYFLFFTSSADIPLVYAHIHLGAYVPMIGIYSIHAYTATHTYRPLH